MELIAVGARAWPAIVVDRDAFAAHVRALVDGPASLHEVHATDLHLAFACISGDETAWRELDRAHLCQIPSFVARVDPSPAFGDEVRQRVAEKLVGPQGKLASYTGRGPLGGWLRIVAMREAQTISRARRSADSSDSADIAAADHDPELALLRRQSAETFRRAYVRVLDALNDQMRTTLRLYFVDGLTYEQLGRVLACSRATAARRVTEAREHVLQAVQRAIKDELGTNAPGVESLFALVESQLQISVVRHLGRAGGG